eukprot:1329443-Heterocapsa_arctica.AAC.1
MSARQGLGKLRHLDVLPLWLPQQVLENRLQILSVSTHDNLADVFTKPLDEATMRRFMTGMSFEADSVKSSRHRALNSLSARSSSS